jgi:hypothetical protein
MKNKITMSTLNKLGIHKEEVNNLRGYLQNYYGNDSSYGEDFFPNNDGSYGVSISEMNLAIYMWYSACLNNKTERMCGEQHHNNKFTTEQVLEIRRLWYEFQFKQTEIAQIFNTKQSVVQRIISGKSWKHLNGGK